MLTTKRKREFKYNQWRVIIILQSYENNHWILIDIYNDAKKIMVVGALHNLGDKVAFTDNLSSNYDTILLSSGLKKKINNAAHKVLEEAYKNN